MVAERILPPAPTELQEQEQAHDIALARTALIGLFSQHEGCVSARSAPQAT
jgi:hypothetical protein